MGLPAFKRSFLPGLLAGLVLAAGCSRSPKLDLAGLQEVSKPQSLPSIPEQVWEVRLQTPPSALSTLDPDHLLIASHRGEVYTFDLTKGKRDSPIWQVFRKGITALNLDVPARVLYIASAREQQLRAFDVRRGRLLWKQKNPGILGPMKQIGPHLFTASLEGRITANDLQKGQLIWERKLPGRIQHGVQLIDSLAVVLTDQVAVWAFECSPPSKAPLTDAPYPYLWKRDLPVNPDAQYVAGNGMLYITDSGGQVQSIDGTNGKEVFKINLGAPIFCPPLITSDHVLVATATGTVIALQANNGTQVWTAEGPGLIKHPMLPTGSSAAQQVLVVFARGELLALEVSSGKELWRLDTGGPIEKAVLTADGVVVCDRRNRLHRYRLDGSGNQRGQ